MQIQAKPFEYAQNCLHSNKCECVGLGPGWARLVGWSPLAGLAGVAGLGGAGLAGLALLAGLAGLAGLARSKSEARG